MNVVDMKQAITILESLLENTQKQVITILESLLENTQAIIDLKLTGDVNPKTYNKLIQIQKNLKEELLEIRQLYEW